MGATARLKPAPIDDAATRDPLVQLIPGIGADGALYPIEKLTAHRKPTLHLAISAFVFSGRDLLIQRRALHKYHCGGLWANTCCTHPHWGESVASAAARRVDEELGFRLDLVETRVVEYQADVGNGLWEHERVHMFTGLADAATLAIRPNPDEVGEARWVSPEQLRAEITEAPERFTPWFRIYVERYPDLRF
jgi:isopentenyl-diphosphate delta-isomerase